MFICFYGKESVAKPEGRSINIFHDALSLRLLASLDLIMQPEKQVTSPGNLVPLLFLFSLLELILTVCRHDWQLHKATLLVLDSYSKGDNLSSRKL